MSNLVKCPTSGLILPAKLVDEKLALKKVIDEWVEKSLNAYQHIKGRYFLSFHAKFNPMNPTEFTMDTPKVTETLPPFVSNSIVWYVDNSKGLNELLWVVAPAKKGEKLKIEFNKSGVAYLQAKGAMPS